VQKTRKALYFTTGYLPLAAVSFRTHFCSVMGFSFAATSWSPCRSKWLFRLG